MPESRRLTSWKEIAVYLNRTVRTVQRWESTEGLPVHRHVHAEQSSISAFVDELDEWRRTRTLSRIASPAAIEKEAETSHTEQVRGGFRLGTRTADGLFASLRHFQTAIAHDPANPLAHANLAVAFCAISGNELWSPEDGYSKARAAALRALDIDNRIALAHTAIGMVHTMFDWDWKQAESAFRTALDLDPHLSLAHHWFGLMLINSGRPESAIPPLRLAAKLDPLSSVIATNVGRPYLFLRRYDEAIAQLRKAFDVDPAFWIAHVVLSWTYAAAGRPADALASADLAAKRARALPVTRMTFAEAHAVAGNKKIATELVAEALGDQSVRYVSPYRVARVCLALGRISDAFEWLERSLKDRSLGSISCLTHDPAMTPILGDRRFRRYLDALNLTAGQSTREGRRTSDRSGAHRRLSRGRAG